MAAVDVARLEADGYLVVDRVIDDETIDRLLRAFAEAPVRDGTQHIEITDRTPEADAWIALCHHSVVIGATQQLLGDPPRFLAHGRNPLPGYGQQGLHGDSRPRRRGEPVLAVTAIWMLDAFTVENGATRVVPRSHLLLHAVPRRYAQPLAHHPDEIVTTGEPGSVLVFNGHLWHSGRRNGSSGPRRAVQMTAHVEATEPAPT